MFSCGKQTSVACHLRALAADSGDDGHCANSLRLVAACVLARLPPHAPSATIRQSDADARGTSLRSRPMLGVARDVRRRDRLVRRVRLALVPLRVQHVHGPRSMRCAATDLIALSVVKDGELHIRSFLEHHFALGVAHVVILLNDSNDRTEEIAAQYERVTILRCSWPYRLYEVPMKRYLVRRFANRRWSLFVDVDELFDYPGRDRVSLRQLVEYLDAHRYTA